MTETECDLPAAHTCYRIKTLLKSESFFYIIIGIVICAVMVKVFFSG
jgi:hypothetical protein